MVPGGLFAVHRREPRSPLWAITHVPTGMRVLVGFSLGSCMRMATDMTAEIARDGDLFVAFSNDTEAVRAAIQPFLPERVT